MTFDRLLSLARDPAPARRAELLVEITELFEKAAPTVSPDGVALYGEIMQRGLDVIEIERQAVLAERVADLPVAPRDLVHRLATGPIIVAEPVLRRSRVLVDADLAAFARELSADHLLAIAARAALSEIVTDALVARGEPIVLKRLAANSGARLSARAEVALREQGGPVGIGETAAVVAPGPDGDGRAELDETRRIVEDGLAGRRPIADAIAAIVSEDAMLDITRLLAKHAGLAPDLVGRMIAKADATPITVLCKAAGVSTATFLKIAGLRGRRFGLSAHDVQASVQSYDRLTLADAERTLRFLKIRHMTGAG